MDSTPFTPIIRTQQDLERAWRHLMGELGFSQHQLWVMLVGSDDRPVRHLVEVPGAVEPPGADEVAALGGFLAGLQRDVVGPEGRVAFLLSRPGRDGVCGTDRQWAVALYDACRSNHVPCEVVHLANDVILVPLPLDELGALSV
jgi:hypothetical protein